MKDALERIRCELKEEEASLMDSPARAVGIAKLAHDFVMDHIAHSTMHDRLERSRAALVKAIGVDEWGESKWLPLVVDNHIVEFGPEELIARPCVSLEGGA